MKALGVIPARYGSTRLPGKPLRDICGKPMIQRVYERACRATSLGKVVIATDDERIVRAAQGFGAEAHMTSPDCPTGTDRVAEVARKFDCDVIVNIQGDEPLILPEIIDEITEALLHDETLPMATGCYRITGEAQYADPNVVKIVTDGTSNALYFSRSLIPYPRHTAAFAAYEHIGIYAYRRDFLMKYVELADTPLALTESLEQLKVLEHGYRIKVVRTAHPYDALSVDTEDDLNEVARIIRERGIE